VTKGTFTDHLAKLELVLQRLSDAGLRINLPKCSFGTTELEYLGYWLTPTGVKPIPKKVEAIKRLEPPKNLKQLRSFLGMINYYRDMWKQRSHILAPLTALTKLKPRDKFRWEEEEQAAFEKAKAAITADVMLSFPGFTKPFDIHTDASEYQLGAVISQGRKPIAFYSRKLSGAQQRYTTGERELLSVVETLREYRNILLGHEIRVFTDHKNNVEPTTKHASNRVQRWRLFIEEFAPAFFYLKGEDNPVADALSRLDRRSDTGDDEKYWTSHEELSWIWSKVSVDTQQRKEFCGMATVLATAEADFLSFVNDEEEICMSSKEEILLLDDLGSVGSDYPLRARVIALEQQRDAWLQRAIPRHPTYFQRKIVEGTELVLFHKMIYIPVSLRERVLAWYHDNLCHPGTKRTERTIRMHLIWPGLSESVETYVKRCPICQTCKATRPKYGHLPLPERELHPWHTVCVDLVGPLTVMASDGKERVLNALTMADPSTGWFEIVEASDKKALTVAKLFDLTWLCRYPRPVRVIHDHGSEFIGDEFVELLQSYGIASVPTTVNNPQANFVERVHQTLWNMLRSQELTTYEFPESKPWDELLGKCAWAIRSTAHLVMDT
jgi:hypothetical protein